MRVRPSCTRLIFCPCALSEGAPSSEILPIGGTGARRGDVSCSSFNLAGIDVADHLSRLDKLLNEATAEEEQVGPSGRALSALIEEERALPIENLEEARNRRHLRSGRSCRRQLLSDGAETARRSLSYDRYVDFPVDCRPPGCAWA